MTRISRRDLLGSLLGGVVAASASRSSAAHATDPLSTSSTTGPSLPLPARRRQALVGSDFATAVTDQADQARYAAATDQILSGNVPAFLRRLTPVQLEAPDGHEGAAIATVYVTADYLSVGSRLDFLRVPLDLPGAGRVATALGMALPTARIVDAIYSAAPTVLAPVPMPPTARMRSMPYVRQHQVLVEQARASQPIRPLIAGHKKDLVLTGRLLEQPDRVAIYGWHRLSGRPIQPLSLVHGKGYADYSHGVRLLSRVVVVDGVEMDYYAALADPRIAPLFSGEGALPHAEEILVLA